jgi:hypothetical protein
MIEEAGKKSGESRGPKKFIFICKTLARHSRLWNAGGPAGLAALEARNAAERQAQLRQRPQRLRPQDPAPLRAGPGSGGTTPRSGQPDNEIIFLCEDDLRDPEGNCPRRWYDSRVK